MAADGTFGDSNLHNCVHTGQLMRLVDHVADVELVACGQACNDVHKAGDAADGALVDDVDLVAVQLAGPRQLAPFDDVAVLLVVAAAVRVDGVVQLLAAPCDAVAQPLLVEPVLLDAGLVVVPFAGVVAVV